MEPRYYLPSGEEVARGSFNRHHIFYPRYSYTSPAERRLRNLSGFIIPMSIPVHRDLHANVLHPPKPSANLIGLMTELYYDLPTEFSDYELFAEQVDYLGSLATTTTNIGLGREAGKLHSNLSAQAEYLHVGRVTHGA